MPCSPTYLSVDLDNWMNREFPSNFLNKIKKLEVPVAVSVHHHELLPHMNYFKQCRRLINVDMHADICGNCVPNNLNCGTWGNFVRWRNQKDTSFIWCYPEPTCVKGRTNWDGCWCDSEPNTNPFFCKSPQELCGWGKVSRRRIPILRQEELNNIAAVGICLSPDYLYPHNIFEWTNLFLDWINHIECKIYSSKKEWNYWKTY